MSNVEGPQLDVGRDAALACLQEVGRLLETAQVLVAQEESCLPTLRTLLEARHTAEGAVVALLAACLLHALTTSKEAKTAEREAAIAELTQLVAFAFSAVCPPCRQRVGDILIERHLSGIP